jgi:hypothetical protein
MASELLDHDRGGWLSVDREVEHGAAVGESEAKLANVHLEGDRLGADAVYDARD